MSTYTTARIATITTGAALAVSLVLAVVGSDLVAGLLVLTGLLLTVQAYLWSGTAERARRRVAELEAEQEAREVAPLQQRGFLVGMCVGGPLDGAELPLLVTRSGRGPEVIELLGPGGIEYTATGVDHTAYQLEVKQ